MEWPDLFRGLKGSDQSLLAGLDELRKEVGADKLYLIYLDEAEAVWGARYPETVDDSELLKRLRSFLKDNTQIDYAVDDRRIMILNSDINEVSYVAQKALGSRELAYQGPLEILAADETKGEALLTVDFTFPKGVKNALIHLLPWVKESEVKFSNDKEDAISVTEKAAKKIKEILESEKIDFSKGGLRFGLTAGGCSGFQYVIKAEREPGGEDEVFEKKISIEGKEYTVRIFVDLKSLNFMQGTVIDYGQDPFGHNYGETFLIKNPNKKGSCGCGKSETF
jgi:iron-sulfur cluster assembly accessory protein